MIKDVVLAPLRAVKNMVRSYTGGETVDRKVIRLPVRTNPNGASLRPTYRKASVSVAEKARQATRYQSTAEAGIGVEASRQRQAAKPEAEAEAHSHSHSHDHGRSHSHSHDHAPAPAAAPAPAPKRDVTVSAEETPNPNARKFNCSVKVTEKGSLSFSSAEEAASHPLGQALFALEGVKSVFAVNDFVTVTKDDGATWSKLQPQLISAIATALA